MEAALARTRAVVVSVLIPTVGGREQMLEQVRAEFKAQGADEVLITYGYSWGAGLNNLVGVARGDYLLCACDDILPHAGWFEAARPMVDDDLTPATRYFNTEGEPLRPGTDDAPHGTVIPWCRSFLLTPAIYEEVGPFLDATWYADIEYSERLDASGRMPTACDGFSFTHLDGDRSWRTDEVAAREEALYVASVARREYARD